MLSELLETRTCPACGRDAPVPGAPCPDCARALRGYIRPATPEAAEALALVLEMPGRPAPPRPQARPDYRTREYRRHRPPHARIPGAAEPLSDDEIAEESAHLSGYGFTPAGIAVRLGVSRQAVERVLKAAS